MSDKFQLLSDKEHIQKRFSMYGGSQVRQKENVFAKASFSQKEIVGGLLKVINEIIDNSVDEYVRTKGSYAKNISVNISSTGVVEVKDDGRGIPPVLVPTADGDKYQMVAAFTQARAGSNFDDDNRESIGMNGVGSMITFVTSKKFHAASGDGKIQIVMNSKNGEVTTVDRKSSSEQGTTVKFSPDYEFFGMDGIDQDHFDMIEERILSLSLAFPQIRFKFNRRVIRAKFADYFGDCVVFKNDQSTFGVTKSNGGFETHSLVNGLAVKSGQHIDTFVAAWIDEFRALLKRKYKMEITRARLKNHLRVHSVINGFKALKFDSQTKERVTNSFAETKAAIGEYDGKAIAKKLMSNKDLVEEIVAYSKLQDDLAAKKELAGLEKKKKIKSDKYFSAIGKTERVFIVEGDSASGGLIKCLGRKGNAFYALKGVPLNVLEVSHQKFMANTELSELYSIINTFPEAEICIATDADADGSRICGLVMLFMHKYFKEHFDNGLVRVLRTPLAIAKKNNVVQEWAYDFAEVNRLDSKYKVSYVKGLGSWSVPDLRKVIEVDTMEKMLPTIDIDGADDLFTNWFSGSTSDFRKERLIESEPFDIMKI